MLFFCEAHWWERMRRWPWSPFWLWLSPRPSVSRRPWSNSSCAAAAAAARLLQLTILAYSFNPLLPLNYVDCRLCYCCCCCCYCCRPLFSFRLVPLPLSHLICIIQISHTRWGAGTRLCPFHSAVAQLVLFNISGWEAPGLKCDSTRLASPCRAVVVVVVIIIGSALDSINMLTLYN